MRPLRYHFTTVLAALLSATLPVELRGQGQQPRPAAPTPAPVRFQRLPLVGDPRRMQTEQVPPYPETSLPDAVVPHWPSGVPPFYGGPKFGEGNYGAGYQGDEKPGLRPEIRIFEPKARVYFDFGEERDGKLDIFHDGALAAGINIIELYWPRQWPQRLGHDDWRMGPNIGLGITSPAGSSGSAEATGAPVLLGSIGWKFEFPLSQQMLDGVRRDRTDFATAWQLSPKAGIEFGVAGGASSDEALDFRGDGAIYVGVTMGN